MKICTFLLAVFFLGVTDVLAQSTTVSSPSRTPTVLIIPFKQVDPTAGHQWISSAIQEDLIMEASQGGYTQAKTAAAPLASADTAQALQEGKDADAELVIFGSYQVSGDQLRVSGEAGDVAAGKVVGTLGVTGQMQDLFKIEDTLAAQLRPLLPRPAGLPQVTYGINQSSVPVYDQGTANAEAPAQTIYSYPYPAEPDQNNYSSAYYPYTSYAYPYYDGGYAYPYYYDYGYPGYYGGLFIGGGYYGRGFYGHGGFDHGGFRGGFHGSVGGFHGGAAFGGAHGFAGGGHGGFGGGGHGR